MLRECLVSKLLKIMFFMIATKLPSTKIFRFLIMDKYSRVLPLEFRPL